MSPSPQAASAERGHHPPVSTLTRPPRAQQTPRWDHRGVYLARDQPIFVATSGERARPHSAPAESSSSVPPPRSALPAPALLSRFDFGLSGGRRNAICLRPPGCHLPAPEMTAAVAFLLLSLLRMAAPKGVWCPACGPAALAPAVQRDVLIALAKQSILSKLHLPDKPNVTQPTSRRALLTALRRLRVQRTDTAAPPGVPRGGGVLRPGVGVQEYEILSFAESGLYRPRVPWARWVGPRGWGARGEGGERFAPLHGCFQSSARGRHAPACNAGLRTRLEGLATRGSVSRTFTSTSRSYRNQPPLATGRGNTTEALGPLLFPRGTFWGKGMGAGAQMDCCDTRFLLSVSVEPSPFVLEVEGSDSHVFQNMFLSLDSP